MQNDAGEFVDLYVPRKCSASNRIIGAKDHASIQINISEVDKVTGRVNGQFKTYAICGAIRRMGQYCDICSSANSNKAHPITNAIDGTERWWQSPPLSRGLEFNQVNVTLDLGQTDVVSKGQGTQWKQSFAVFDMECNDVLLFHVAYVLIKFANSPRPDLWVLERSTDFGLTYEPWQYFASSKRDCIEKFGLQTVDRITRDDHAICTTEYSRIVPLENGEIVVSLVNGRPGAMNFSYSPLLRNFTKATNIRLRFLQTNTLLGHLMGKALRDPTVTRRYYYSIKDISIGGRCVCHGHADVCDAKDPSDPYRLQCDCQHNTCGGSCDRCCPGFNQFPWKPATADSANECQPCNCNGHAYDCYYDPEVDRHKASKSREDKFEGGGVCIDCQHHTTGVNCERCIPGYYRSPDHPIDSPYICYRCNCKSDFTDGTCEDLTGRCYCKPNYTGEHCDACAEGYLDFPHCYHCDCYAGGTEGNACRKDPRVGMCVCKPNFQGTHCDQCTPGHYGPLCQPCSCDSRGAVDNNCSPAGQCRCHMNFAGHTCNQCALGFYGYPSCTPCQCSREGSLHSTCDQETGQCSCRPKVMGLRCDSCVPGAYGFPHCEVGSCNPAGLVTADPSLAPGSCACRAYIEGPACDRCKPLYWNLTPDNPYGCTRQRAVFLQTKHLWPVLLNVQGWLLQYGERKLLWVPRPVRDHYFPDLHHLKFELEEGTTPAGRAVRFGYNPLEFEGFSWRGYAQMSSIQPKVVVTLNVTSPDLFRLVFRYVSRGSASVEGRVSVVEEGKFNICGNCVTVPGVCPSQVAGQCCAMGWWGGGREAGRQAGRQNKIRVTVNVKEAELYLFHVILRYINSGGATVYGKITAYQPRRRGTEQSKQIVFAPSTEPAFVTVPQNSFGEPFVLNPNTWSLVVEAEGVLLDYLVLLPSSYYEAPILQLKVTEPCTYQPAPEQATQNCLLYKYLSMDGFPAVAGVGAVCRLDNRLPRGCPTEQLTPSHPQMAMCSGNDVEVQLSLPIAQPGKYVLVVEYANPNALHPVGIAVSSPHLAMQQGSFTFYPCVYSFLCRGVAVDSQSRLATFELTSEATIRFIADLADFFLHKVYLVPAEQFTMEFVEPKVHCISVHGMFSSNSSSCIPSRFLKLSQSVVLEGGQALPLAPDVPLAQAVHVAPSGVPLEPAPWPPTAMDSTSELILLQPPQAAVIFNSRIQNLGRYAFVLHYYQPNHPTFPVEVLINGGRIWQGQTNATFCPHGYGCRSLVVAEDQIVLDVTDNDLMVVVRVPEGKQLWLDYILVVPEDSYSSQYLQEEPLDKSYDFISSCGINSFYINPSTSSRFCRDSAISLSLFYNNGAQPCQCHEAGARGSQCEPFGGQCPCKSNVIGRECSRCATGYWGFPNCRPCDCGTRLCDEVTGQCICPPHTLKPECVVCEPQTFGCHPLVGCEDCNCSQPGVQELTELGCDVDSGQCKCKPNIIGRQCDLCAPGYYHYPSCQRCDCHPDGTEASVCDPVTGQCHCKENVEGPRCDQCRLGTFSLDASNPKGCTKCFCFGATNRCRSAVKYRAEFIDMNGWLLLSSDRQEVPTALSPREQLLRADLRNLLDAYQELYWVAPSSYLGDRVSSYGGHLRYELHSDPRRGDVFIPMESRPDVILKGNQMSIMFLEGSYPSPGEVHEGQLQLVESNFRHTETHNPVSREELMMVLANLEQLQIRAIFSQLSSSVSLRRVALEVATDTDTGVPASNVELCFCPANYLGDSCQVTTGTPRGYFWENASHVIATATQTSACQGLGYALTVSTTQREITVSSARTATFAIGCVHKGSSTQCLCKPGYAGPNCERCAPGYYGNPLVIGSSCQPCDCSGNTDPNMLFSSCDALTGACTGCMHHTAGARCEVCAPGFYGDAVAAKNCTQCECRGGSCDPRTGECTCSNGLTGKQCDVCMHDYEIPVANGPDSMKCEVCDSCVLLLLEDLQSIEMSFPSIRSQLVNLNASSIAWARLRGLNSTMATVAMMMTHRKANHLDQHTRDTYQRGEQLLLTIQSIQKNIGDLVWQMARFGAANASTTSTEEFRQKMAEVERMLREMKERSLGSQEELARREHREAQKLLDRVKSELHAHWESNQVLMSSIQDWLAQHSSQLMDLRDALNEAVNKTRQTEDLNSLNRNNLEESQQKSRELQKQYGLVQETLRTAEDALAKVSNFLQKMENAKEAYEKLAALLDGAKLPLTERVKKFSPASSKIPIVEQAEEHARLLDELARNLSSIIQGTNQDGFIQRAIDASNVYASIIEAVKKAERAAHDADEAAAQALMGLEFLFQTPRQQMFVLQNVMSENLGAISKELKRNSSNLEEAVRGEQTKLNGAIKGTLQTAKDKLADLRRKKEQLLSQLQSVQDTLGRDQVDTKETIQNAKAAATEANETAAGVENTLSTMRKNLDEWKDKYGGLRNEDVNQAVQDARKSVSSLESTIPLLLGKLSSLENRRNKNATVSENIMRIRQLITQARNAASKVKVPMKFNGSSGVQVRMPSNLQDLAAYTSLKFYIQNPEPRSQQNGAEEGRFVLYLGSREATGDYMGIVLKDRRVQWVYKLGNEEPASLTIDEEIGEQFAAININRILQYGQMSVIVERQTVHETKGDSVAKGEQGLLNLDPHNVVFYVGGYPSSFMPPPTLRYPNYRGCLELDTLNEEVVSLYNFQHTFQLDTTAEKPCARSKSTGDPWLTDGSYFDGTGYAEIKFESQFGTTKRFEQEIRIVSYNGILFFLENQAGATLLGCLHSSGQFLCLAIRDGKLVLYYDFNTGLEMAKPSSNSSSISSATNKAIQIFLLKMNNKKRILVRLERLTIFMVEQENSLENAVSYYLGGVPPAVLPPSLKALFPMGGSIRGCMKGLKALGKYVDLKRMNTVGVSYGCTSDLLVARSISVHGYGYLTLALKDVPGLRDFYSGFSFQTSQRAGMLYHHSTQEGTCQVSLQRGQLALNLLETKVTTENIYADDRTHYVAFYSDAQGVRLYVDDELQDTAAEARASRRQRRQQDGRALFQLGGSPEPGALSNLTGCIGNVFVKRRSEPQMVVDLHQNVESINVTMSCPWEERPQQLRVALKKDRRKPKVPGRPSSKDRRHDQAGLCRPQPRAARGTFHFGGSPSSRWEFEEIPASFGQRCHFSLEVRLNSSHGLLFYVAGERGTFMALFVSHGRFVFLVDIGGRRLQLRSKDKYHDRRWHTVFFGRDQSRAQLVIDGLRARSAAAASTELFVAQTPLYVGGVPHGRAKAHILGTSASSFNGCLRNPQLDGKPLGTPSHSFGVTPCYEGPLESGIFFAADGGSVTLADAVATEQDLEVTLEVRPRSASGLIFHLGTRRSRHLMLYMEETKVTLRASTGADEFSTSVTCPSLCDGQWHTITEADEASTASALPPLPHYVGCIRNLLVNRSHVNLQQTRTVRGSVGLKGCPVL
ncbi:UNVERIFIED_CONTAM: hypothetical protein H355_007487 [Colinus virginianus]|nr:hypothetical protein H355_007487 [Colinus virginianus]